MKTQTLFNIVTIVLVAMILTLTWMRANTVKGLGRDLPCENPYIVDVLHHGPACGNYQIYSQLNK
jgi:predicted small secreted protein